MASVEAGAAISDPIAFEANNSNGTASLEQHPAVNSQKMATIEHNFATKVDMSEGKPENAIEIARNYVRPVLKGIFHERIKVL